MFFPDVLTAGVLMVLAAAPVCELPQPVRINVLPREKPVKYDYSQDMAALQGYAADTINPHGFDGMSYTQGLARNAIRVRQETRIASRTYPGPGMVCLWYESIRVEVELEPEILIAREVKADPCRHRAVLEHEMKHVAADRQIVNGYAGALGRKILQALEQRGFKSGMVAAAHAQDMTERMQRTVQQVIEQETRRMETERADKQGAIDTREEYERVAAACPR